MNELRRLGQGLPLPKRAYSVGSPDDYLQCIRVLPGEKPVPMGEVTTVGGKSFWLRDHSLDSEGQANRYKNRIDWKKKGDRYVPRNVTYPPRVVVRIAEKQLYAGESREICYKGKEYLFTRTSSGRLTFQGREVRS